MSELKSDKLQWELAIKDSQAQKAISDLNSSNRELEKSNKAIRTEMAKLEAQNKTTSDAYKQLKSTLDSNNKTIKDNSDLIKSNEKELGISNMTLQQVRKRYNELKRELDNTSKALDPQKWEELNKQVNEAKDRMGELSGKQDTAKKVSLDWASAIKTNVIGVLVNWGQKLLGLIGDHLSLEKIINSTQKTGDEFAAVMAGVSNSMEYVRRAIANADFSNFIENLENAYDVAYKTAQVLDELFERENSFKIKDIKVQAQIENLQEQLRNVNLSDKERIAAANEIERLTKSQASIQKGMAFDEATAYKERLQNQTKLSDSQLTYIVENYNYNRDIITQAREYLSLTEKLNKMKKTEESQSSGSTAQTVGTGDEYLKVKNDLTLFKQLNKDNIAQIQQTASILQKYDQSTDEYVNNYVNAQVKFLNIDVESNRSLRKVITSRNTLIKEMSDEALKKSKEADKLSKEQKEKAYTTEIKAAEDASLAKQNIIKKEFIAGEIGQEQYNILIAAAEDDLLTKKIEVNQIYKKSTEELETQLLNNQLSRIDKAKEAVNKYAEKIKETLQKALDKNSASSLSEINQFLDDQNSEFEKSAQAASKYFENKKSELDKQQELYNQDKLNLKNALDAKLLTQEQFEDAMNRLEDDNWQKRIQINAKGATKIIEVISNVLGNASTAIAQIQEIAFSKLEAQKNKELELAGSNADERAAIEEKYEKKKLEVQKRYADIDMVIKISQALANGALAIMQAYATLPTPAAIAMTPVIAGLTAIQVAAIIAQRNAIQSQTYSGSSSSSTTSVRSVNSSDSSTASGTLSVASAPRQRSAEITYDINKLKADKQSDDIYANKQTLEGLKDVANEIKKMRETPIKTYVVLDEHNAAQEVRNKLKKEGSL